MPLPRNLKKRIKDIINHQGIHSGLYEKMDVFIKVYKERLEYYDLLPDGSLGENIILTKPVLARNCSADRPDTPQSLAQLHPGGKDEVINKLNALRKRRQPSLHKRKFFIYLHNEDWTNALKYHKKLCAGEMDSMEEIREYAEEGNNPQVYIDNTMNGGDSEYASGDNAYLQTCNFIKIEYKFRKSCLHALAIVNGIDWDPEN